MEERSINERIDEATERLADEKQRIPDGSRYLAAYRDRGSVIYADHMDHIRMIKVRMKQQREQAGECLAGEAFDKSKNNEILIMSSLEIELLGHAIDLHALGVVVPLDFLPIFLSMRTFPKIFDLTPFDIVARNIAMVTRQRMTISCRMNFVNRFAWLIVTNYDTLSERFLITARVTLQLYDKRDRMVQ